MTAKIKGITEAAAIVAATLLLLGYCTPAPAAERCDPINLTACLYERDRDPINLTSHLYDRDAEYRADRLQDKMEEDVERANRRDRTLCQPAEDCRRTTWRRGYRR